MHRAFRSTGLAFLLLIAGCNNRGARPAPVVLAHPLGSVLSRLLMVPLVAPPRSAPSAATARRPGSRELSECPDAELRRCLEPFVKPELTAADILALERASCFRSYSDNVLGHVGTCLPLRVGVDTRSGNTLVFNYFCSELCAGQGSPTLVYENVSADECCKLGAEPFYDGGWGGYSGCEPKEIAARRGFLHHSTEDGKWRRIVGSRCPGRGRTIYEEWDCEPPPSTRPQLGVVGGRQWLDARPASNLVRHPSFECSSAFNPVEAEVALRNFDADAHRCLTTKVSGRARVKVTFAGTGDVDTAWLKDAPSLSNAERHCVESVYRRVHTLPFKGESVVVWHDLWWATD